jgi:hypothetical protein
MCDIFSTLAELLPKSHPLYSNAILTLESLAINLPNSSETSLYLSLLSLLTQ